MADSKELSFETAVRWLTAHAGTAVWIAVSSRDSGHLLTFAAVLQVPEGETWRPLPGTPVELEPDQLERASIRAGVLKLRLTGGIEVDVWRRIERHRWPTGEVALVDPSPRADG
jgi:hypothetical protein